MRWILVKVHIFLLFVISISHINAQSFPWPQNINYTYGFKPSAVSQATMTNNAQTDYNNWTSNFVTSINAGGYQRVKYQQASSWSYTASEGIGYGMILSAYMGDKALFDDLYNYYNLKINGSTGLMFWKTDYNGNCSGSDCDAATDGDQDIAYALLVAHCQWGSSGTINYKQKAINAINAIMNKCVDLPTGRLRPGPTFGGSYCVDPSYFTIAYYPLFQAATGDANWNVVRNYCLNYFNTTANNTSGLFRDWSKDDGSASGSGTGPLGGFDDCSWREQNYAYDAARIPWRLATDYLWNGTIISRDVARKMVDWTNTSSPISGNTTNFRDCMNWNGSGNCGGNSNNPIVGGMAVGAMTLDNSISANVTWANNLYTENRNRTDDYFYNATLRVLYQFVQSGNFWKPTCDILPVDLLNFSIKKIEGGVLLSWETTNEKDIMNYVIERSSDGLHYSLVGEISAKQNGGSYVWTDTFMGEASSLLYYRLSEKSYNGELTIIKTNSVLLSDPLTGSVFTLYPNPLENGELKLSYRKDGIGEEKIEIEIIDLMGSNLLDTTLSVIIYTSHISIPVNIPAGIYYVRLKDNNNDVWTQKLLVK